MGKNINLELFLKLKELGNFFKNYSKFKANMYGFHTAFLEKKQKGEIGNQDFVHYMTQALDSRINYFSFNNLAAKMLGTNPRVIHSEVYLVDKSLKYYKNLVEDYLSESSHDYQWEFNQLEQELSHELYSLMEKEGLTREEAKMRAESKYQQEYDKIAFLKEAIEPFLLQLRKSLEAELDFIDTVYGPLLNELTTDIAHGKVGAGRIKELLELPDDKVGLVLNQAYQNLTNVMRPKKLKRSDWKVAQIAILFYYLRQENIISENISGVELSGLISQLTTYDKDAVEQDLSAIAKVMSTHKFKTDGKDAEFVAESLIALIEKIKQDKRIYIHNELAYRKKE
ncbi:hypothetical protein [Sabulibacter ruber]|uniref:hypothetical protein n=1 Tax=Sabulibacter ruber TaxID=2811901 RepID=UPI001A962C3D|nr:hypothetical protein [Sabulibacter ruber]